MFYLIIIFLILSAIFFWVRFCTFLNAFYSYKILCRTYCQMMNKNEHYFKELSMVWPMRSVLYDIFNWKVEKYIVNIDMRQEMMEDLYKKAMEIMEKVKNRNNINLNPESSESTPDINPPISNEEDHKN